MAALVIAVGAGAFFWSRTTATAPEATPPTSTAATTERGPSTEAERSAPPDPAPHEARPVTLPDGRRPNILLFTIDTLRADHLGAYGYARPTTPNLDALAARGTRFARAYSSASWTLPAMASMLTGVLPSEHGARQNHMAAGVEATQDMLSAELPSLVEALRESGYYTAGVTGNIALRPETGFGRGFVEYECAFLHATDDAREPVMAQIDRLRDVTQPWFLWVHIMDPHAPYRMRQPAFSQFWGEGREAHTELETRLFLAGLTHVSHATGIPRDEVYEHIVAAYDSEIVQADAFFAEVLERIADPSLVVLFTADHGEEIEDHHLMGHGENLFEETVHVPMVLAVPGRAASVVTTPVQLIDVFPTLAEIAGASSEGARGISLLAATEGTEPPLRDLVLESGRLVSVQAIVAGRFKYGEVVGHPEHSRLFDVLADPLERTDLREREPALVESLRARLYARVGDARSRRPDIEVLHVPVPDDVAERLRAIGYVH